MHTTGSSSQARACPDRRPLTRLQQRPVPGSKRHLHRELTRRLLGPNLGVKADMSGDLVRAAEEAVAFGGSGRSQVAAAQCLCLTFAALLLHKLHAVLRMDSSHSDEKPGSCRLHGTVDRRVRKQVLRLTGLPSGVADCRRLACCSQEAMRDIQPPSQELKTLQLHHDSWQTGLAVQTWMAQKGYGRTHMIGHRHSMNRRLDRLWAIILD